MVWKNWATTRSMRLNKQDGDLHYEIILNLTSGNLILDCENTSKGKREFIKDYNTNDLLKRFPDLKEWETLLYAYEEQGNLIKKIKYLENKYEELKNETKKY
ncbi:MAG: hypothetical protein R6U15_06570 [Candidatus Izemoplasmatales bacterium]